MYSVYMYYKKKRKYVQTAELHHGKLNECVWWYLSLKIEMSIPDEHLNR